MSEFTNKDVTKEVSYPFRKSVKSRVVAVLDYKVDHRGLILINTRSRALCKNEIHEILVTDDKNAKPGAIVDPMSLIAFVEIVDGGIILAGDKVNINNVLIGQVAGYDETHFPNHINIVLFSEERCTGFELGIQVDDVLSFAND